MRKILLLFLPFIILLTSFSKAYASSIVTTNKLITVDLAKEQLTAWNHGQIVYQTPISAGLPLTPTVTGTFHIYWKLPYQEMKGTSAAYGSYDLPNVPNVMYFYEDYAIHGAYWHHNFGSPASHGCINVPVDASAFLYSFAPVGTEVVVY